MGAILSTDAPSAMDGKNKNSIQTISNLNNAFMEIPARNRIVHIIILKLTENIPYQAGSNSSQKLEQ